MKPCAACAGTREIWDPIEKVYVTCLCAVETPPGAEDDIHRIMLHGEALAIYIGLIQGLAANPYHRPQDLNRQTRAGLMAEAIGDAMVLRALVRRHIAIEKAHPPPVT